MRKAAVVVFLALMLGFSLTPQASQQAPPRAEAPARDRAAVSARTARIRGRVVSAQGAAPLRRALVRLSAPELREARSTLTDDQGRYEFGELAPGSYSLSASKAGYLTLSYGQRLPREAPQPISVAEGEVLERIDLPLPKGSVIVVHVTDDWGEPLSGIRVTVQQYRFVNGQRQLTPVTSGPVLDTNDLGEFRAFGLPPGEYYVTATAALASPATTGGLSFTPAYYPGTLFPAEAQPLRLGLSQEIPVTLSMTPARPARITGVVRRSDGGAPAGRLQMYLRQSAGAINPGQPVNLQQDGSFVLTGVIPGDYVLDARPTGAVSTSDEFASMPIKVAGDDVSGLVVATRKGSVLRGVVTFDTGAPRFGPGNLQVVANALDTSQNATTSSTSPPFSGRFQWQSAQGEWGFQLVGLAGRRVVRLTGLASGWSLKSVKIGDRDVTDTLLDFDRETEIGDVLITLTEHHSDVNGQVLDRSGAPVTDCTVVFFPADADEWNSQSRLFGTARPDRTGRFSLATLPGGRYLAAAVEYLEAGAERDPELLEQLRRSATSLNITEGENRVLNLRVSDR